MTKREPLSKEDRKGYRSRRLRNGTNRTVDPIDATPRKDTDQPFTSVTCTCGAYLQGTEADFAEHRRLIHGDKK